MTLTIGCPRCLGEVWETPTGWQCVAHGHVAPCRRPRESSYDAFGEHLLLAGTFPTLMPWPLSPGWRISDFALVGGAGAPVRASLSCVSGPSDLDGPVDFLVIAEEPGTGLGARCAGLRGTDPGSEVGLGPPAAHVRIGSHPAALWTISTGAADPHFDRSAFVGEASGRWLWLVLRPASAMLLLQEEWVLGDVSEMGPQLVEVEFGGPSPGW
jgi:hypothetical protein